jgi:hypothetical protein
MATIAQLEEGIRRADAAGDGDSVRALGAQLRAMQSAPKTGVKGTGTYGLPAAKSDLPSSFLRGATFGLLDEVAGGAGAVVDAVRAPFSSNIDFDPVKSYQAWRDRSRGEAAATNKAHRVAATGLEVAGALGNAPIKAVKALPLGKAVVKGGMFGAGAGALAGFGSGEGLENSISGAEWGAMLGAPIGAAAPVLLPPLINAVGKVATPVINVGKRLIGRPVTQRAAPALGRQVVAKAMLEDGVTSLRAGQALDDANTRGVPLALGDIGDNLRGLTGSLSRKPGKARTLVREMVDARQAAQGERVRNSISRDLGPIANPLRQSDVLMNRARMAAAPHYEKAYATPPINSPEIEGLLSTPAGRKAMSRAQTIAANERRDPTALGFALDDEGNVVLNPIVQASSEGEDLILSQSPERVRQFSPQTMDYVKRGLDDVVEANRDKVTRRLNLDEGGRAEAMVRDQFREELKRLNPDYANALRAYQGPASARQAMEAGKSALNYSDHEIERAVTKLSEADRQQFALGFRAAMAEALDRRVDGADKVGALLGSPRKRKALAKVFGGEDGLDNFLRTMADERLGNETYRAVRTGSPTAERVAEDENTGNLVEQGGLAAYNAVRGNVPGLLRQGANAFQDYRRFGAGQAAQRAREDAAALLTETDPVKLRESLREALRNQALLRARLAARRKASIAGSVGAGEFAGSIVGPAQ